MLPGMEVEAAAEAAAAAEPMGPHCPTAAPPADSWLQPENSCCSRRGAVINLQSYLLGIIWATKFPGPITMILMNPVVTITITSCLPGSCGRSNPRGARIKLQKRAKRVSLFPDLFAITFLSFLLDDPYYCGLSARVPNFVKSNNGRAKPGSKEPRESVRGFPPGAVPFNNMVPPHFHSYQHPHPLWHARSYESGMGKPSDAQNRKLSKTPALAADVDCIEEKHILPDSDHIESPYNHIYGRLPMPNRPYVSAAPRAMFVGEWD